MTHQLTHLQNNPTVQSTTHEKLEGGSYLLEGHSYTGRPPSVKMFMPLGHPGIAVLRQVVAIQCRQDKKSVNKNSNISAGPR